MNSIIVGLVASRGNFLSGLGIHSSLTANVLVTRTFLQKNSLFLRSWLLLASLKRPDFRRRLSTLFVRSWLDGLTVRSWLDGLTVRSWLSASPFTASLWLIFREISRFFRREYFIRSWFLNLTGTTRPSASSLTNLGSSALLKRPLSASSSSNYRQGGVHKVFS